MSDAPLSVPTPELCLNYPTLDLFLYDLQDGLGQSAEAIDQTRRHLWQGILNGQLTESRLADIKARESTLATYIELLADRYHWFAEPDDGYYYPVKLGDTLAVRVDSAGQPDHPDWATLSLNQQLQRIKTSILTHAQAIPGKMGRSWLLWGQLATDDQEAKTTTARHLLSTLDLIPQANWEQDCKGQGLYQGATLYDIQKVDDTPDGFNRNHHLVICLFPAHQTKDEIKATLGQLYRHLMRLFYYRNKVLWAYEQGFQLKTQLKAAANTVQTLTHTLPQRIAQSPIALTPLQQDLATALTIAHYCEQTLGFLAEQAATIAVNLENYDKRLTLMMEQDATSNLTVWQQFSSFAQEKYLTQLQADEQTLTIGLKPLDTFIKTVGGIIEIEKAKSDRTLNHTVAIASVGISVASLAASTFTEQAKQIVTAGQSPTIPQAWTITGLAFGVSVGVGLLSALITAGLLKLWQR